MKFFDTYKSLTESLQSLISIQPETSFAEMTKVFTKEQVKFLRRKGVFCYNYIDSFYCYLENCLPPREAFYNDITEKECSWGDYRYAQQVWVLLNCNTLGDYSDNYLLCDVLLLCGVFEEFRQSMRKIYTLDPAWTVTLSSYAFLSMLNYTIVELELLTDYDQMLFVAKLNMRRINTSS